MKKNQDLTPSQAEQTALSNLVTKIQNVLDGLIISPGSFEACVSYHFSSIFARTDFSVKHKVFPKSFERHAQGLPEEKLDELELETLVFALLHELSAALI